MQISDIVPLVRYLINDNLLTTGKDIFTYTTSLVFTLTETGVSSVTALFVNDVAKTTYSYSSTTNKVTYSGSLTAGDTVEIQYSYYPNYSSTEISNYVRAALIHLSVNNYYTFTEDVSTYLYPEPTDEEKNLIAAVTAILIDPNNITYRLPDITISVPNTSLPTEDKIRRLISAMKKNSSGEFFIVDDSAFL